MVPNVPYIATLTKQSNRCFAYTIFDDNDVALPGKVANTTLYHVLCCNSLQLLIAQQVLDLESFTLCRFNIERHYRLSYFVAAMI